MMIAMTSELSEKVRACDKCKGICEAIFPHGKDIGIDYAPLTPPIKIMFVAESPPGSADNFFYNSNAQDTRFRKRLFKLINESGLGSVHTLDDFNQHSFYLADAINCRWNKSEGSNGKKLFKQPTSTALKVIAKNCLPYLTAQIDLLKPQSIVFMGEMAKNASHQGAVQAAINSLGLRDSQLVRMPFILTAPVKTEVLVSSLKQILNKT